MSSVHPESKHSLSSSSLKEAQLILAWGWYRCVQNPKHHLQLLQCYRLWLLTKLRPFLYQLHLEAFAAARGLSLSVPVSSVVQETSTVSSQCLGSIGSMLGSMSVTYLSVLSSCDIIKRKAGNDGLVSVVSAFSALVLMGIAPLWSKEA